VGTVAMSSAQGCLVAANLWCWSCRQAVTAAESYIQQHGLDDVQIEVETTSLEEVQEVRWGRRT